jgi:hypothetical protein
MIPTQHSEGLYSFLLLTLFMYTTSLTRFTYVGFSVITLSEDIPCILTPIVKEVKDIKDNHICQRTTHSPYHISAAMSSSFHHRVPDSLEALKRFDGWAQSPAQRQVLLCHTKHTQDSLANKARLHSPLLPGARSLYRMSSGCASLYDCRPLIHQRRPLCSHISVLNQDLVYA